MIFMYCNECGETMQWRSTNQLTGVAKWKCPNCGNVQIGADDYEPLPVEDFKPKYYYFHKNRFIVRKVINHRHVYFGAFGNEETAKKVVEKLEEHDWDKTKKPLIYEELGIHRENKMWVSA